MGFSLSGTMLGFGRNIKMSKPIREPPGSSVSGEPRWEQSYHTGGQHSHHLYQDCREGVAKHQGLEKGSQRM